jgi:hypothetical protein
MATLPLGKPLIVGGDVTSIVLEFFVVIPWLGRPRIMDSPCQIVIQFARYTGVYC